MDVAGCLRNATTEVATRTLSSHMIWCAESADVIVPTVCPVLSRAVTKKPLKLVEPSTRTGNKHITLMQ